MPVMAKKKARVCGAIGIDLGGTNVRVGLVSAKGKLIIHHTFLTKQARNRSQLLNLLIDYILLTKREARRKGYAVCGVGLGGPGPIDVERGFVYSFTNIAGWKNTPLKKILEKRTGLPSFIDNDANAMALGEALFGAGKGCRYMLALTLGTGIGGGLVLDGKLFHGSHFSAVEIGHVSVNENGLPCNCGNRGCIETVIGNGYFVRDAEKRLRAGQKSLLRKWIAEGQKLTPRLVERAARKGDRFSQSLWRQAGERLGGALAGWANVLNPERIVIGGGIAGAGNLIFKPMRETLKKKAFPIAAHSVKVIPAKLGVDAGIIGAAALAFSES